ncbi:ATP-binding protein [Kallotenue papyrolyticum]|uniref:ATP-binding protein n=1 Tax=Kallotenue papyrolyticum TaxID=1325125 RepID=UPI00046F58CF|nr:ATP-binding protein [Kallotenue papyrolyticum]
MQQLDHITLQRLLEGGEHERLAFARERSRPEELAETLAALANRDGGLLLVGVSGRTRARLEGLTDAEQIRERVLDAALLCTPPLLLPLPEITTLDGQALIIVEVPAGLPHVYSLQGRYLWRAGAVNQPIPPHALRQLLLERGGVAWERLPAAATLDDLDPAKIQRYVERVGPAAGGDALGWLERRGCLTRAADGAWQPTHAGLLLFARDIERHLPQCEITLVRYRGLSMSDEFERLDLRDTLPEQARRAEAWLRERMRTGSRLVGLERRDWIEYPPAVVREVLINAIAHRDYAIRGEGIRITMFADRLECYSPGRLPGHVTVENIRDERYSRNEVLVQALSDLGLIERLGYGIDRVLQQMAAEGLPAPLFRETAAGFLVTLQGHAVAEAVQRGQDTAQWQRMGLNQRQIAALLWLAEHQRITNRDYRELAPDISDETVRRDLADLVERGLLLRIGDRRGTYYILR